MPDSPSAFKPGSVHADSPTVTFPLVSYWRHVISIPVWGNLTGWVEWWSWDGDTWKLAYSIAAPAGIDRPVFVEVLLLVPPEEVVVVWRTR